MLNATLIKKERVTSDLFIFRVKPDLGVPSFTPGQYVALALPGSAPRPADFPAENEPPAPDKLIKRAYSIGSTPLDTEYLEFYIAIVKEGLLTSRLVLLEEGDRLFCAPKITGHFTLHDVPFNTNLVLVATGTGLAPFMSMIKTPSTWQEGRSITVLHGVRHLEDLGYRAELEQFAREYPNFSYRVAISREDASSLGGIKGYVQEYLLNETVSLNPAKDHIFLCGNPGMVDAVEKFAVERGYVEHTKKTPGSLHLERYW